MNKIKLMHDVIKTMKDKEVIKGTFKAEGRKDQNAIFGCNNEFEKNTVTGQIKAKINVEFDCDGNKVKHESTIDINTKKCHEHAHHNHDFMKHMHEHHHGREFGGGFKEKLNKLAFALNILNSIKVDEQQDKSVLLSLSLNEIPEEIKQAFKQRHEAMCQQREGMFQQREGMFQQREGMHQHHAFMKELHSIAEPNIELNVRISKNSEIESIVLSINGKQNGENSEAHDVNGRAELNLAW